MCDWSSDVCSSDLFVHPLYATNFNLPDLKTSIAGQVGKFLLRHGRQAHEPCETAHCSGQQQHDDPCEKLVQRCVADGQRTQQTIDAWPALPSPAAPSRTEVRP